MTDMDQLSDSGNLNSITGTFPYRVHTAFLNIGFLNTVHCVAFLKKTETGN